MLFILGYITGLVTAVLTVVTLIYFGKTIDPIRQRVQQAIESAGPRPKGFIVEPDSEIEEARKEIIEENKKQGKDTPISELL